MQEDEVKRMKVSALHKGHPKSITVTRLNVYTGVLESTTIARVSEVHSGQFAHCRICTPRTNGCSLPNYYTNWNYQDHQALS